MQSPTGKQQQSFRRNLIIVVSVISITLIVLTAMNWSDPAVVPPPSSDLTDNFPARREKPEKPARASRTPDSDIDDEDERFLKGVQWYELAKKYYYESNYLSAAIVAGKVIGFEGDRRRPAKATQFFTPDYREFKALKAWANPVIVGSHPLWSRGEARPVLRQASFSPDGRMLALNREGAGVELIDIATGETRATLADRDGWLDLRDFAFGPDGTLIAACGARGRIGIWKLPALKDAKPLLRLPPSRILSAGDAEIHCLAFSPAGTALASGGEDEIKIWSVAKGTIGGTMKEPGARSLSFSADGLQLAAGATRGRILKWNFASGASPRVFQVGRSNVAAMAFGPDDALVGSIGDGRPKLWDANTGKFRDLDEPEKDPVLCWAFSPDGRTLAGGCRSGTVRFWDMRSGDIKARLRTHQEPVKSLAFAPDGHTFVSMTARTVTLWDAGYDAETDFGGIHAGFPVEFDFKSGTMAESVLHWDLRSGTPIAKLANKRSLITSLSYAPSRGELFALDAFSISAWNAHDGTRKFVLPPNPYSSMAADPTGHTIAAGDRSGKLWLFDPATRSVRNTIDLSSRPIHRLAFSPDGRTLTSYDQIGQFNLWQIGPDGRNLTQLAEVKELSSVASVRFSPDGQRLAVVGRNNRAQVFSIDVTSGKVRYEIRVDDSLRCLAFSADGTMLAAGGRDLRIFDADSGAELTLLGATHRQVGGYRGVAFHPDGKRLYSFSALRRLREWDLADHARDQRISAAAYLQEGFCRLTTNELVWDVATNSATKFVNVRPSTLIGTLQSAPPDSIDQTLCRSYLRAGALNSALLMHERLTDPARRDAMRRDLFVRLAHEAYSAYFRDGKEPLTGLALHWLRRLQPLVVPQEKDGPARAMKRLLRNLEAALKKSGKQRGKTVIPPV